MNDLEVRKQLLIQSLEILRDSDDPRRFAAIRKYEAQLTEIEKRLKPPDIVISLSPGKFKATVKGV
jgi:hypothetical protein